MLAFPVRSIWDIIFSRNRIATLSEVVEVSKENKISTIHLKGLKRIKLKKIVRFFHGMYEPVSEGKIQGNEKLREELRKKSQEMVFLINVEESDKLIHLLNFLVDLYQLTDFISNYFVLKFPKRFHIYNKIDVVDRAGFLISVLDDMIAEIKQKRDIAQNEKEP